MKDVMRESTQIALTCAKIKLAEWVRYFVLICVSRVSDDERADD